MKYNNRTIHLINTSYTHIPGPHYWCIHSIHYPPDLNIQSPKAELAYRQRLISKMYFMLLLNQHMYRT